jgi:phosphatidylglycerophosphate synthase
MNQRVSSLVNVHTVSFRQTLRHLSSAQKSAASGAPPYSLYINRRAGKYVAAAAYNAGWSPNRVSGVSALLTFSGIALLATASNAWWVGTSVWALLAMGYAFDSADGQVARLRGGGSPEGEWLDHVLDSAKLSTLHLAVLIAAHRNFGLPSEAWLLVPIAFSAIAAVSFFSMILNDQLKAIYSVKRGSLGTGVERSLLKSILLVPTDYGVLCFLFIFVGSPDIFIAGYTLFFIANSGHLILASHKWFNDMKKIGSAINTTRLRGES